MREKPQHTIGESEYSITLPDGHEARATVNEHGGVVFNNGNWTENHSFLSLVNKGRRGALPAWVKHIPALAHRIEALFEKERAEGVNPHQAFANGDGKLTVTDLKTGTSLSASVADLKRQFQSTGSLPRAFESPKARQLLGLTND